MDLKDALVRLSQRYADTPLWLPEPVTFNRTWDQMYLHRDEVLSWKKEDYEPSLLSLIRFHVDRAAGGDKPIVRRPDGDYTVLDEVLVFQCITVYAGWFIVPHPQTKEAAFMTHIHFPTFDPTKG